MKWKKEINFLREKDVIVLKHNEKKQKKIYQELF